MNAETIRSEQDIHLFKQLLEDREVKQVNDAIERQEQEGIAGTRRRLLATSVRLSETMATSLHAMSRDCAEALGVDIPVELYVFNSAQFNAACVKPEEGRLFVMFSSSLLEGFAEDELRFVMGHELGHFVYQHHDIPIGYLLRGQQRIAPELALRLTSWSRYAEFSADRAGAFCTGDFSAVARALFKLASGLTGSAIRFSVDDFLRQVSEMKLENDDLRAGATSQDWFLTHPFSPLRVKALQQFHQSPFMTPGATPSAEEKNELEVATEGLMSLMEPSYLESQTDAAKFMSRLLFAGSLLIARTCGPIGEPEIEAFEKFFGKRKYSDNFNLDQLEAELPDRIAQVREHTSIPKRMQVLRDLCIIACADGHVTQPERKMLNRIADDLEVSRSFIEQTLEGGALLD